MSDIIAPANADEKNIAVVTHITGIFFSIFPGLIVWLLKKDESPYISEQAREALNFQITLLIAYLVAGVLVFILIGLLLFFLVWLANIVFCIMAAVAASKGENYRYPISLRLIN
ncbi:MAG: DUF4870 domain-containing protein [Betaproteobacteria bacterium HGW-Betaproteobacteria-2]|jgi:hypothetical protein|nr:MAG: DUF4870 domain-containing protein [Betaproteobacteria bacterium HGW-Betaproteobacteria-2]PKO91018.1 MAG: DUF4870 domain-containing protein [Betaproteobacteria bacterium HGW-Betaproteobacteria-1]